MWDLLGPGIEPVIPALAGIFLTTGPPRKFQSGCLNFGRTMLWQVRQNELSSLLPIPGWRWKGTLRWGHPSWGRHLHVWGWGCGVRLGKDGKGPHCLRTASLTFRQPPFRLLICLQVMTQHLVGCPGYCSTWPSIQSTRRSAEKRSRKSWKAGSWRNWSGQSRVLGILGAGWV